MYNSDSRIQNLIESLPVAIQSDFFAAGERLKVRKSDFLVTEGTVCRYLYIIEKGVFRTYRSIARNDQTIEITSGFSFPGDFDTSPSSLILKVPSNENIQALVDGEVMRFDFTKIESMQNNSAQFNELIYSALIDYTAAIEKVLFDLRVLSARERYDKLLNEHPDYIQYIPLKYIASFLNMKEETLSRIRKP